jgi:uncharacterized membrane protein
MTEPTSNYSGPPPPPTSPWTPQDPYAPYAGQHARSDEPLPGRSAPTPPYQPYAGGPPPDQPHQPHQPYAGGPGYAGPGYGSPYGLPRLGRQRPPAHWPLSIVGVLFSLLFGAIAVYFSVQVGRRWDRGDVEGAQRASRTARTVGIIAIVLGAIATAVVLSLDAR